MAGYMEELSQFWKDYLMIYVGIDLSVLEIKQLQTDMMEILDSNRT